MWYIAKNYYCPEEPNFELLYFETKLEVDNYLTEYIVDMTTTPMEETENSEFYDEMKKRHVQLLKDYPGDIVKQALELVSEDDEDWKIDIVINIEKTGYTQYTEHGCYFQELNDPKWMVYKIDKDDEEKYEFELSVFSTEEELYLEYYDDYEYETEPKNVDDWIREVICNMDDDNTGIVAIQNLHENIKPVWTLEYEDED